MAIEFAQSIATTLLQTIGTTDRLSLPKMGRPLELTRLEKAESPEELLSALNVMQRLIVTAFRAVQTFPLLGGVYVPDVAFAATTDTVITHRVQDTVAWLPIRMRTNFASFKEITQTTGKLTLQADAACTADILVFRVPRP